jgi:hypothetical protein
VLLLDEIEKAHSDVHNILLQLFDEGRLTDRKGRLVDFTNTIIIATSIIGSQMIQDNMRSDKKQLDYPELRDRLMEVLRHHFRPEFLNRVDEVVVFHALGKGQIRSIVDLQLARVQRTAAGQNIVLSFDDSLREHLAEIGYDPEFGARMLKRGARVKAARTLMRYSDSDAPATSIARPHAARFIEQITLTIPSRDSSGNAKAMSGYPASPSFPTFSTPRFQIRDRDRHALIRFFSVHVILVS